MMKTQKIISGLRFLILATVFFSSNAFAVNVSTIPNSSPSTYRGVRQVGMGNAGLALSGETENNRDNAAWLYNPAAMNDYDGFHFDFLRIQGDISLSVIGLTQDVFQLNDDISAAADTQAKIDVFNTFVTSRYGNFESLDVNVMPFMLTHKHFSFATLVDSRTTISFRNQAFTNFEVLSRGDAGGVVGTSYSFLDNTLQAGLNLKVLYRGEVDEVITVDDILNQENLGANLHRGIGVGGDLGVKYAIPTGDIGFLDYLAPTAAVTYQDIGNTRFTGSASNTEQSVSAGLAVHPRIPLGHKGLASHLAIDMRDLNQNKDLLTKLNVGYEIEMPTLLFINSAVRAGLNQGYPTAGASLDFKLFKLELAAYEQEMGTVTRQKGIWRFAFNTSFGF